MSGAGEREGGADEALTHVAPGGEARMVDVSEKPESARQATARGTIRMKRETLEAIRANQMKKGDVVSVARVAGVMAAKRTAELIPLCHSIPLHDVQIAVAFDESLPGLEISSSARSVGKTGVEMEALTAVTVALLTVYDMAKAMDREMEIGQIVLIEKTGGVRGDYARA